MGGIGVIFLNFLVSVSCNQMYFDVWEKKCKLCLYLEDGDVTVKENAKVCFGCSMIKSLTPD